MTDRELVADQSRLGQVVENLMRNAIQHGGPDVTITIEDVPGGFAVEDTGTGVDEGDRDRIFQSGYSSEADGTGLGLAIARTIVEAHGWSISVTDGTSGGARFEITGVESSERSRSSSADSSEPARGNAER